jgi:hypothetical protein
VQVSHFLELARCVFNKCFLVEVKLVMLIVLEMKGIRIQVCVLPYEDVFAMSPWRAVGYCFSEKRIFRRHIARLYYAVHPLSGRPQSLTSAGNR